MGDCTFLLFLGGGGGGQIGVQKERREGGGEEVQLCHQHQGKKERMFFLLSPINSIIEMAKKCVFWDTKSAGCVGDLWSLRGKRLSMCPLS